MAIQIKRSLDNNLNLSHSIDRIKELLPKTQPGEPILISYNDNSDKKYCLVIGVQNGIRIIPLFLNEGEFVGYIKNFANTVVENKVSTLNSVVETISADEKVNITITTENGLISELNVLTKDIASAAELKKVKDIVDVFFANADISEQAELYKDTLKELQDYITSDSDAAHRLLEQIENNKKDIETLKNSISGGDSQDKFIWDVDIWTLYSNPDILQDQYDILYDKYTSGIPIYMVYEHSVTTGESLVNVSEEGEALYLSCYHSGCICYMELYPNDIYNSIVIWTHDLQELLLGNSVIKADKGFSANGINYLLPESENNIVTLADASKVANVYETRFSLDELRTLDYDTVLSSCDVNGLLAAINNQNVIVIYDSNMSNYGDTYYTVNACFDDMLYGQVLTESTIIRFSLQYNLDTDELQLDHFEEFALGDWSNKQDRLVSGTNIKTFDGISLLGGGNIPLINYVTLTRLGNVGLSPNYYSIFPNAVSGDVTFQIPPKNAISYSALIFQTGTTIPVISFISTANYPILWSNNSLPVFESNRWYEFNFIVNATCRITLGTWTSYSVS